MAKKATNGGGRIARDSSGLRPMAEARILSRAARENWPVTAKEKANGVLVASEIMSDDEVDARARIAAVKAIVEMDRVNQSDYWNADKNARIDAGQATENIQYQSPPIQQLPLPPHLASKVLPPPREG